MNWKKLVWPAAAGVAAAGLAAATGTYLYDTVLRRVVFCRSRGI